MRLAGGIHELIFAPADFDVNTLVDEIALQAEELEKADALEAQPEVQMRRQYVRTIPTSTNQNADEGLRYKYPTPRIILNVLD